MRSDFSKLLCERGSSGKSRDKSRSKNRIKGLAKFSEDDFDALPIHDSICPKTCKDKQFGEYLAPLYRALEKGSKSKTWNEMYSDICKAFSVGNPATGMIHAMSHVSPTFYGDWDFNKKNYNKLNVYEDGSFVADFSRKHHYFKIKFYKGYSFLDNKLVFHGENPNIHSWKFMIWVYEGVWYKVYRSFSSLDDKPHIRKKIKNLPTYKDSYHNYSRLVTLTAEEIRLVREVVLFLQ